MGRTDTDGAHCRPLTVDSACAIFGESSVSQTVIRLRLGWNLHGKSMSQYSSRC